MGLALGLVFLGCTFWFGVSRIGLVVKLFVCWLVVTGNCAQHLRTALSPPIDLQYNSVYSGGFVGWVLERVCHAVGLGLFNVGSLQCKPHDRRTNPVPTPWQTPLQNSTLAMLKPFYHAAWIGLDHHSQGLLSKLPAKNKPNSSRMAKPRPKPTKKQDRKLKYKKFYAGTGRGHIA